MDGFHDHSNFYARFRKEEEKGKKERKIGTRIQSDLSDSKRILFVYPTKLTRIISISVVTCDCSLQRTMDEGQSRLTSLTSFAGKNRIAPGQPAIAVYPSVSLNKWPL